MHPKVWQDRELDFLRHCLDCVCEMRICESRTATAFLIVRPNFPPPPAKSCQYFRLLAICQTAKNNDGNLVFGAVRVRMPENKLASFCYFHDIWQTFGAEMNASLAINYQICIMFTFLLFGSRQAAPRGLRGVSLGGRAFSVVSGQVFLRLQQI